MPIIFFAWNKWRVTSIFLGVGNGGELLGGLHPFARNPDPHLHSDSTYWQQSGMELLVLTDAEQSLLLRGRQQLQDLLDAQGRGMEQLLEGREQAEDIVGGGKVWLDEGVRLTDHTDGQSRTCAEWNTAHAEWNTAHTEWNTAHAEWNAISTM